MIPNRIALITHGRYDEAVAAADCWPGMVLQVNSNNTVQANGTAGAGGLLMVAIEDALQGLDITQKLPANNVIPFYRPTRGDMFLMLLQAGSNVAEGANLMSAGDGTLIANTSGGSKLYEIVAPSATITNTAAETVFSNGSYTIPANFLQVGDVVNVRGKVFCIAENSTNTHNIKIYVGNSVATGALTLFANDIVDFDLFFTIRTIGASGTEVADGNLTYTTNGVSTPLTPTLASSTLNTTASVLAKVSSTASSASTGNQIRLDEFQVNLSRALGEVTIAVAAEAVDNSGSTGTSGFNSAAFIRCWCP